MSFLKGIQVTFALKRLGGSVKTQRLFQASVHFNVSGSPENGSRCYNCRNKPLKSGKIMEIEINNKKINNRKVEKNNKKVNN